MSVKIKRIEETESFILEFEREESLWNVRSPSYKNRDEKKAALSNLATLFSMQGTLSQGGLKRTSLLKGRNFGGKILFFLFRC